MNVSLVCVFDKEQNGSGEVPDLVVQELTCLEPGMNVLYFEMPIRIGTGSASRVIGVSVPIPIELNIKQETEPVSLLCESVFQKSGRSYTAAFMFRSQLFSIKTSVVTADSETEAILLIKTQVLSNDSRLISLKKEVAALKRISETIGHNREPISDTIKLVVFERDEGKCVRCGMREQLHFDHIIPVSKGGGNSDLNIQLLCEGCNLRKGNKLAF